MSLFIICCVLDRKSPIKRCIQPSNVEYNVNINDRFAVCQLKQKFHITTDRVTEASYQFPVDYNAAFCDLLIKTPREEIKGVINEKAVAKKMYDQAKSSGRQAFLAEESKDDRDIYKLSMCNLLKGDDVTITYTYVTEVAFNNNRNIFYIPSFISPRYGGEVIVAGEHAVKSVITINNRSLKNLSCTSPNISVDFNDGFVCLTYQSDKPLDTDVEITYDATYENKAYKFTVDEYTMAMAQIVPTFSPIDKAVSQNVMFVLDRSYSMQGENRILNSRTAIIHCLKKMLAESETKGKSYHFNILSFGSNYNFYKPEMIEINSTTVAEAVAYCEKMEADLGGTEMQSAMTACLTKCRTAIMLTDGDVTKTKELHKLCCRFDLLSILGIGSGINRANLDDMAKYGSGIAIYSQNSSNIGINVNLIFSTLGTSALKNPSLNWFVNPNNLVLARSILSDRPNNIYAIMTDSNAETFELGDIGIKMPLKPLDIPIDPKYLGCLIAKRIVQENEISSTFTQEKMVDLAIKFNIITPHTSLIAVSNLGPIVAPPEEEPVMHVQRYCVGSMSTMSVAMGMPTGTSNYFCSNRPIGKSMIYESMACSMSGDCDEEENDMDMDNDSVLSLSVSQISDNPSKLDIIAVINDNIDSLRSINIDFAIIHATEITKMIQDMSIDYAQVDQDDKAKLIEMIVKDFDVQTGLFRNNHMATLIIMCNLLKCGMNDEFKKYHTFCQNNAKMMDLIGKIMNELNIGN